MIQPPEREAVSLEQYSLHADEGKNGISEGKDRCQHTKEGHGGQEKAQTETQEEQPHAPAGNCLGQRNIHFTLSLEKMKFDRPRGQFCMCKPCHRIEVAPCVVESG